LVTRFFEFTVRVRVGEEHWLELMVNRFP